MHDAQTGPPDAREAAAPPPTATDSHQSGTNLPHAGHMSAAEFRTRAREVVDFIADYLEGVERFRVGPSVSPGDVLAALPAHPPEHGEPWDAILHDSIRDDGPIIRGLTHWQHPGFYGYFPANTSYPAVLGDLLSSGLGVNGMLWATSPACTELEIRVLDWLAELLDLPTAFRSGGGEGGGGGGGVIQGTASEATLVAMLAARARALAADPDRDARTLIAYASSQAHSSVIKGAMIAGLARSPDDRSQLRVVEVDADGAMRTDELTRLMREDTRAGLRPFFICATLGTTSSTANDPIDTIGRLIEAEQPTASARDTPAPWLHVDAAFSGAALICPEFRSMARGLERADSFCFNPHKWLLTTFDCDCFWTRDRASLARALSITPEYLRNPASASGAVIDFRDWQVPLGRRFRSLKLWFVLRHYGRQGLQAYIREHVRIAAVFEALVLADDRFELAAPRTTSLICFRLRAGSSTGADDLNRRLHHRINADGRVLLTHTVLPAPMLKAGQGAYTLRLSIGTASTQERHIRQAWQIIQSASDEVCSGAVTAIDPPHADRAHGSQPR